MFGGKGSDPSIVADPSIVERWISSASLVLLFVIVWERGADMPRFGMKRRQTQSKQYIFRRERISLTVP